MLQANRDHYSANREVKLSQNRMWKIQNAAMYSDQQKEYYRTNKPEILARHAANRAANLEKYRAIELASHKKNRQTWADASANRRARQKNAPVVERIYRKKVYERDGGKCYLCRCLVPFGDMHLEHVIPLCKGGEHSYANVRVSCKTCNQKKGSRILQA